MHTNASLYLSVQERRDSGDTLTPWGGFKAAWEDLAAYHVHELKQGVIQDRVQGSLPLLEASTMATTAQIQETEAQLYQAMAAMRASGPLIANKMNEHVIVDTIERLVNKMHEDSTLWEKLRNTNEMEMQGWYTAVSAEQQRQQQQQQQ